MGIKDDLRDMGRQAADDFKSADAETKAMGVGFLILALLGILIVLFVAFMLVKALLPYVIALVLVYAVGVRWLGVPAPKVVEKIAKFKK